jgi:hypothetical protein
MTCKTCILWSDGYQGSAAGYCYSQGDFTDGGDYCDFWQQSLRAEPVNAAPILTPDELLAQRVAAQDVETED